MQNVIKIPESLARELDHLAEAEHKRRTAYAVDVLWRDVKRHKQHQALKTSSGTWNPVCHPELAEGGAAYVEKIRSEPDERFVAVVGALPPLDGATHETVVDIDEARR